MINSRKKISVFAICFVIALLIALTIFSIPTNVFGGASSESYEDFYNTFMQMVEKYDNNVSEGDGVVKAESTEDELGYDNTRLIVNSTNKIDVYGADMWCGYNGTYILQYKDSESAQKAYENYQNSNLTVFYDIEVSVSDTVVEDVEIESNTVYSNANSYYSWGWNSVNDYLGVNSYLASLSAIDESSYRDVVVAVFDSGINTSHVMFKASDNSSRILSDYARGYTGTGSYEDDNGHGTHVSGTIAEVTPDCVKILPLKVLDSAGNGRSSYILNALNYLLSLREGGSLSALKVINMSLGISSSAVPTDMVSAFATSIAGGINALYDAFGVLSVVSAGNGKQNTKNISPANVAKALTISALEYVSDPRYINAKLNFDGSYSNYGEEVDFAAPGTNIKSAYKGGSTAYETLSGTSMAAPHATACVALFYVHPDNASVGLKGEGGFIEKIENNANKDCLVTTNGYAISGGQQKNNYYGYGCINIAGFGTKIDGDVSFSVTEKQHSSNFNVTLSYSKQAEYASSGKTCRIYYTKDQNVDSTQLKPSNMVKSNSVSITESTKITAVAYVYNDSACTSVYARSNVATITYYIANKDIESNYAITGNAITSYYGTDLETLEIPTTIDGKTIETIGQGAFSSSIVKILRLPTTISQISDKAFYLASKGNTSLEEVYYSGAGITIGSNAFRGCKNLSIFDVDNITKIDSLAFYGTNIQELFLDKIKTIGKNAFTQTALNNIFFGNELTQVDSQTLVMNGDVYGFNSIAENFANSYSANYHDLRLQIVKDLGTKKYTKVGQNLVYNVVVGGYNVSVNNISGSLASKVSCVKQSEDDYKATYKVTLTNPLVGGAFSLTFKDAYNQKVTTSSSNVTIVSGTSYTLDAPSGNYQIYVDGDLVSSGHTLYSGVEYVIKIVSIDGYYVKNIVINGIHVEENEELDVVVSSNVAVSLNTGEENDFEVNFDCPHGEVFVGGSHVETLEVARNSNLIFTVNENVGYKILRVNVNGSLLIADSNGIYTIEDITTDVVVDIVFEQAYYTIDVTYVSSCGHLYSDDLTAVAYGTKNLPIKITANSGYSIDFVTVNGRVVSVVDGQFVIDVVDKNMDVVVAFKESKSIFSSENSGILYYFIVFGVLFVLFILGRIVLAFAVKKKNKEK